MLSSGPVPRPVPGAERGPAGVGRVLQGQGQGAGERARGVQRVQCLSGRAAQTHRGGGAYGDGPHPQGGRGESSWQRARLWTFPYSFFSKSIVHPSKLCIYNHNYSYNGVIVFSVHFGVKGQSQSG